MIPLRISGNTHRLSKPKDWDDSKGRCADLSVRIIDGVYESLWEPTPNELEILNRGGRIVLGIMGGQPPVRITVEEPPNV